MTEQPTPGPARPRHGLHNPHYYARLHAWLHRNPLLGLVTKIVVTTIGTIVILAGIVMLVTPGPGLVAIAVGLGILATEWDWADRWVKKARAKVREAAERARRVDPAVRRRRIALGATVIVVAAGVIGAYLVAYGWPVFAVDGWRMTQQLVPFLPDLPGM